MVVISGSLLAETVVVFPGTIKIQLKALFACFVRLEFPIVKFASRTTLILLVLLNAQLVQPLTMSRPIIPVELVVRLASIQILRQWLAGHVCSLTVWIANLLRNVELAILALIEHLSPTTVAAISDIIRTLLLMILYVFFARLLTLIATNVRKMKY